MALKACSDWREGISDFAAGGTATPALREHGAHCRGCAAALAEWQAKAAAINSVVERLAAVEAPVYGPDRVMARIGGRQRAYVGTWWRWAAAAAVAIVTLVWMWPVPRVEAGAISAWHSPTQGLLQSPAGTSWSEVPRFGEGIFKKKPGGGTGAQ